MNKYDKFPAKVYVDSFLKPDLFIYKNIFKDALFQINYAQCIMLNEQSIINDEEAKLIFSNPNRFAIRSLFNGNPVVVIAAAPIGDIFTKFREFNNRSTSLNENSITAQRKWASVEA